MEVEVEMHRIVRVSVVMALLWVAGCASRRPPAAPPALAGDIEQAERRGKAIFEQDVAAARATDELLRLGILQRDNRVHGWIAEPTTEGWLVRFGTESGDYYEALYDVLVPSVGPPSAHTLATPERLMGRQETMFRARQTAIAVPFMQCSDHYNTVVMPDDNDDGWLVYLLAATTVTGEMVFGGHQRMRLTADGRTVVEHTPLSKSCLRIGVESADVKKRPVAAFVTHLISPSPIETHVYLSLLHHRPLFVRTSVGTWLVTDGRIEYAMAPE